MDLDASRQTTPTTQVTKYLRGAGRPLILTTTSPGCNPLYQIGRLTAIDTFNFNCFFLKANVTGTLNLIWKKVWNNINYFWFNFEIFWLILVFIHSNLRFKSTSFLHHYSNILFCYAYDALQAQTLTSS